MDQKWFDGLTRKYLFVKIAGCLRGVLGADTISDIATSVVSAET